jgi:Uri superfamily endonuclease
MERLMFTDNDLSTELAWEILKKQHDCWHTDYCTVSCEECENYVTHRDLEKAIDIIIEERISGEVE